MKRQKFAAIAVAFGGFAGSASATLIDFNSLADGTIVSNQFAGVTFASGTGGLAVPDGGGLGFATNTGLGVSSTDVGSFGTGSTLSGMVLHRFADDWILEDGDAVFVMTFDSAITDISIDFGGIFSPASTGIYAFSGGSLVASAVAGTTPGVTSGTTLSLSGLVGATQIAVTPGDFDDWVGVDNINYTSNAVPEPASMAFLGIGAVALFRRRRK